MKKKNTFVTVLTLVAFCNTIALPIAAFAEEPTPPTVKQDIKIDVQPAPVKVVLPKKQTVVVEGPVIVTTGGAPLPVEGTVTVKGDPESPLPVRILTDRPLPMTIVNPIEVKEAPRYQFEKTWWFWTAVILVTGGAVTAGICGGGYCGGTHRNTMTFQQ